jgi:amino acid transporter
VTGWVLYVEYLLTQGGENPPLGKWALIAIALLGLWLPALINLNGVSNVSSVQVVTTVLKFLALAVVSVVGLFFIDTANYRRTLTRAPVAAELLPRVRSFSTGAVHRPRRVDQGRRDDDSRC